MNLEDLLDSAVKDSFIERPPLPQIEYSAVIMDITDLKESESKFDVGEKYYMLTFKLELDVPFDIKETLGLNTSTFPLTHNFFVDIINVNGRNQFDTRTGKNKMLSQYRKAIGKSNEVFRLNDLRGARVRVTIKHRVFNGSIKENVGSVLPARDSTF